MKPVNPLFEQGLRECNVCHEIKDLVAFSRAGNSTGHQYTCKPCAAERTRRAHTASPHVHRDRVRARKQRLLAETRALKDVPCADCGGVFPPVCMDFDHLGDKMDGVSRMVQRGFAREALLAEIEKCDVVCANCHRIRTAARGQNATVAG